MYSMVVQASSVDANCSRKTVDSFYFILVHMIWLKLFTVNNSVGDGVHKSVYEIGCAFWIV
jgi:hypothetical protein